VVLGVFVLFWGFITCFGVLLLVLGGFVEILWIACGLLG